MLLSILTVFGIMFIIMFVVIVARILIPIISIVIIVLGLSLVVEWVILNFARCTSC